MGSVTKNDGSGPPGLVIAPFATLAVTVQTPNEALQLVFCLSSHVVAPLVEKDTLTWKPGSADASSASVSVMTDAGVLNVRMGAVVSTTRGIEVADAGLPAASAIVAVSVWSPFVSVLNVAWSNVAFPSACTTAVPFTLPLSRSVTLWPIASENRMTSILVP